MKKSLKVCNRIAKDPCRSYLIQPAKSILDAIITQPIGTNYSIQ